MWESGKVSAAQTGVFSFQDCLPQVSLSFDDLDTRDENNQPVMTAKVQQEMKSLFQAGLFSLLVRTEIHSIAQALGVIERSLNLAATSLTNAIPLVLGNLIAALLPSTKQWNAILACLSSLFVFLAVAVYSLLTTHHASLPFSQIAPSILRC